MRCVIVSDLHVGSTVGLWPRSHPVADGGIHKANQFQRWLINYWEKAMEEIANLRPDVLVFNGDEIQGAHDRDGQLVTNRIDIQVDAALEVVDPLASLECRKYVIRGTPWHVGKAAEHIDSLARQIGAERDRATNSHTRWELYLKLGKPVIHFAHHIGASRVPLYETTTPLRDMLVLLTELNRYYGRGMPNLKAIVRSHRHRGVALQVPPRLHAIVTPGWQLKTEFGYKNMTSSLPHIGYVVIDYDGEKLIPDLKDFPLPKPAIEVV